MPYIGTHFSILLWHPLALSHHKTPAGWLAAKSWFATHGQSAARVKPAALRRGWESWEWAAAALWQLFSDAALCRQLMAGGPSVEDHPLHADDHHLADTLVRLLATAAESHRTHAFAPQYANGLRMLLRLLLAVVCTVEGWAATFHALGGGEMLTRVAEAEDVLPQVRDFAATGFPDRRQEIVD